MTHIHVSFEIKKVILKLIAGQESNRIKPLLGKQGYET
jgi:hypothetical protein